MRRGSNTESACVCGPHCGSVTHMRSMWNSTETMEPSEHVLDYHHESPRRFQQVPARFSRSQQVSANAAGPSRAPQVAAGRSRFQQVPASPSGFQQVQQVQQVPASSRSISRKGFAKKCSQIDIPERFPREVSQRGVPERFSRKVSQRGFPERQIGK